MCGTGRDQRYVSIACRRKGRKGIATGSCEQGSGLFVACESRFGSIDVIRVGCLDIAARRSEPVLPEKIRQSLLDSVSLELVGQDRGHRHGQVAGDFKHRQVGMNHGIEQPFLAEGVSAKPLDVRHM